MNSTTTQTVQIDENGNPVPAGAGAVDKGHGMALYIEFHKPEMTAQYIICSEAIDPVTKAHVPVTVISRVLTPEHYKRGWTSKAYLETAPWNTPEVDPQTGQLVRSATETDAAGVMSPVMDFLHVYLRPTLTKGWTLYKEPFYVQMSGDDVRDVAQADTPENLIMRINRVRKTDGFDALFDEKV